MYASVVTLDTRTSTDGWALVGEHDWAEYYPIAAIPIDPLYALSPIALTGAYHTKITTWDGKAVPLPTTIDALVLWAQSS